MANAFPSSVTTTVDLQINIYLSQPRKGLKCWYAQNANVSALAAWRASGKRTLENLLEKTGLGKKKVGVS